MARNISIAFEESWKVAQEFLAIHHLPADLNNKILQLVNELNTIQVNSSEKVNSPTSELGWLEIDAGRISKQVA